MSTSTKQRQIANVLKRKPRVGAQKLRVTFGRRRAEFGEAGLTLLDTEGNEIHTASAPVTASLRSLVARLRVGDGVPARIGVISAIKGEGVTSVVRSLALVLASDAAKRVCIVDLNWWSPAQWPVAAEHGGMAEVLSGRLPLAQALVPTGSPSLFVVPAGQASILERPVLTSGPELAPVLATLTASFDHVLVDLPAVHATSEALTLAEHAGSLAVVVRQGITSESQVKAALDELSGVPVLGVVLNAASTSVPSPILHRILGA